LIAINSFSLGLKIKGDFLLLFPQIC